MKSYFTHLNHKAMNGDHFPYYIIAQIYITHDFYWVLMEFNGDLMGFNHYKMMISIGKPSVFSNRPRPAAPGTRRPRPLRERSGCCHRPGSTCREWPGRNVNVERCGTTIKSGDFMGFNGI